MHCIACLMMVMLMGGVTMGTPVRTIRDTSSSEADSKACSEHAKSLLITLKKALNKEKKNEVYGSPLFHGFNCTDLASDVIPNSETVTVCQPFEGMKCSDQPSRTFSESNCLKSIGEDLRYHRSKLDVYVKSLNPNSDSVAELNLIISSILNLQENCPLLLNDEMKAPSTNIPLPTDSFEDRKSLCKQLKGFHLRAITINRALGYIGAGEYKK